MLTTYSKGKATDMSPDSGDSAHRTAHPPTPPYEVREELSEGKIVDKSGKVRTSRRQAQAIKFPWNRKMDFVQAAQNATWDDSIYDPVTLMAFNATREHNVPRLWQETENETIRLRKYTYSLLVLPEPHAKPHRQQPSC